MRVIGSASDSICTVCHGQHHLISNNRTLKFHTKCQSLGTPFLKGIWMMCCKRRHPLLLDEYLITFPRYVLMIFKKYSDSIYKACRGQHHVITAKDNYQISCKMPSFWLPLCIGNEMLCCKERHKLMFNCFCAFLRYTVINGRALDSISKPFMGNRMSLL